MQSHAPIDIKDFVLIPTLRQDTMVKATRILHSTTSQLSRH